MFYIKVNLDSTVCYPYDLSNLQKDFPNTSFPIDININDLQNFGVYQVYESDKPISNEFQLINEITPIQIEGNWVKQYEISEVPDSIREAIVNNRKENKILQRNQLLSDSDWSQFDDVPEETKSKWAVYRQALRDITTQQNFPDVEWPSKPE